MRIWSIAAGILLTLMLATGCTGTGSGSPQPVKLAVINHEMTHGGSGSVAVQVTVKNAGSVMAELAQVTVNFYDARKNLVYSSSDAVMNLGPGETWDFELACRGTRCSQVKSYQVETMAGTSSGGL